MAGELVSFGIQKLWDILSHEHEQFQGVKDQVDELKADLTTLESFLKDTDAKKHTSARVRDCVEKIKEIICDAEDIIETFILKDELGKNGGIKITVDVRLDPQPSQQRLEFDRKYESNLVGLEANVKKLVGYLVEEDDVPVVSMTGMDGLGKTTLARQAFNHDKVKKKFDRHAWVCVSQVCDRMKMWQTILRTLRPNEEEKKISEMTDATLQCELFRFLEASNSLIVFDDIWEEEDWNLIKPIFPHKTGSKVLLSSRNESVAGRGDTTVINFKLECLSDQDSWTLFQRIAMPSKAASGAS